MTDRTKSVSRRRLLQGAGLTGVAAGLGGLPFMSSLVRRARAQDGQAPTRLIFFCSPNEPIDRGHWLPSGSGASFDLTSLPAEMASLEPFRQKLLMLGDMEMSSRLDDPHPGGHIGMGHLLIGRRVTEIGPNEPQHWGSGISVDQYIGQQLGIDPLVLGVRVPGSNGNSRLSYLGDSQPVDPVTNPATLFDNLFGDATLPAEELAALKAQRLSVLDRVSGDLERLKTKLPSEGAAKLEVHADMVRDLEIKIAKDAVVDCSPTAPGEMDYNSNANFPTATRRMIDVMIQAMGCGLSDIASIQLSNSGASNITPVWADEGINLNVDYHNIVHDYNNDPGNGTILSRRREIETFFYSMFAYLLEQLEATPEGAGTMLDNSVVVWMKPIAWKHRFEEFLFMIAGSGGGQIETGRFLSFPGQPHNNLLVNLCNLMGLEDQNYGDPAYCTGPLDLS